jgi:hypothetical protein
MVYSPLIYDIKKEFMAYTITIFQYLIHLLDRNDFLRIERQGFNPKRKYRTLSRWGQLVAMMFVHLANRSSPRDIDIARQLDVQEQALFTGCLCGGSMSDY